MKNPFIQSLRQALGEVINWDAVADKPTGDISYMEKIIGNIDFEATQKCTEQYEQQFKQKLEEDGTSKTFK